MAGDPSDAVSRAQVRVLRALADTIWPAQEPPADATTEGLKRYYSRSGADDPAVAREALATIKSAFMGINRVALLVVLYLLSWPLTTLLLFGRHCMTWRFPFVLAFPDMSLKQREAALLSWRHSWISELRGAFKALKAIVISCILTVVDSNGYNPNFEAVSYPVNGAAPPPEDAPSPEALKAEEVLSTAVVDARAALKAAGGSAAGLAEQLKRKGFKVAPAGGPLAEIPDAEVELVADAVVVGSGAGGGVAAAQLAAAGLRVIVVEKGGWKRMEDLTLLESESYKSMFERSAFCITEDGGMIVLAGATMGGGTKINWCASLRTPDHVRNEWAEQHGLPRFATPEYDASMDSVLSRLGVTTTTNLNGNNGALYDGLCEMGADARKLPRNCSSDECSGFCSLGCKTGHKASTDANYLADAARRGARVLLGVRARRVITEANANGNGRSKRTVGVELRVGGDDDDFASGVGIVVRAPIVISSAGSIHSPALLLRSGISCRGNVGNHLRLHPAFGVMGQFDAKKQDHHCENHVGNIGMFKGVMMLTYSLTAARWEEDGYGAMVSVPSLHPGLLAACHPWQPGQYKKKLTSMQNIATSVVFARDCGSGRVTIDASGRPRIHYWPNKRTRTHIIDGMALALRAYQAAGATSVMLPHAHGDLIWRKEDGPEALERTISEAYRRDVIIHDMPLLSAHQMGSCRMGGSPNTSVCDGSGECWEVEGLYVADASAFPTASGVNPMITAMSIAHMVSSGIAQRATAARKAATTDAPAHVRAATNGASPSKKGLVAVNAGGRTSSDSGNDDTAHGRDQARDW